RPPGWSRGRRVVCLRSGLRPSLRHTTQSLVPQLSHEHWYRNRGGVNSLDVIFGWSQGHPLKLALGFVVFGQGDIPNLVEDLLEAATKNKSTRPTVIVG
ncbi:MAG: hypothetical protein NT089_09995, partial [Planctomycetia bacterium]|nr:hypothetical protein [Planctomycetia bacterium]